MTFPLTDTTERTLVSLGTPPRNLTPKQYSAFDDRPGSRMHEKMHDEDDLSGYGMVQQGDMKDTHEVLGQFSFAPATQTTVVTTTTTTTTSFPPLMMKAPNHLHTLDAKFYPLAACPTPPILKRLTFEVGGRRIEFCEADNASQTLREVGFHSLGGPGGLE